MPTRYPNGVTTAAKNTTLGEFILQDPTDAHVYFDDFDTYTAADWTVTETSTSATEALADADGGILLITNTTTENDQVAMQKVGESFLLESGKKTWFKARLATSEATQTDLICGLCITDTSLVAGMSDGVYFFSADGSTDIDFFVEQDSTATEVSAVGTLADDTYVKLGFYYNGVDAIEVFVDDVKKGTAAVTNIPDDEELTVSFVHQTGSAASATMSIDYVFAAKER